MIRGRTEIRGGCSNRVMLVYPDPETGQVVLGIHDERTGKAISTTLDTAGRKELREVLGGEREEHDRADMRDLQMVAEGRRPCPCP